VTGKPINFVYNHHIDQAFFDVGQQSFESRTFRGCARQTAVVVAVHTQQPTFSKLASDEGFAGLSLGVQRVEFLFETFLR
jgi:hypothetical protein